jgi:hypothetical protein
LQKSPAFPVLYFRLTMPGKLVTWTAFAASVVLVCAIFALATAAGAAPAAQKKPSVTPPVITSVELRPAKMLLVQPCPVELVFAGEITTSRPISVTYTWVDSRGRTWPEHHRRFTLAGVNTVNHKWKVGRPGKPVDAWVQLKVISPESRLSNKVPVHFTCAK